MIDIVIVNWNAGGLLKDCIYSILQTSNESLVSKLIIVDNQSSDNSIQLLPHHPKIRLILNSKNEGFARAANQGFRESKEAYTLLLNPDTRLNPDTLSDCFHFMETNPRIDIMGCQLYNNEGKLLPSCSLFPTASSFIYEATGLSRIAPRLFPPATLMLNWDHQTDRYVDQLMGAFLFMRTNLFDRIGYFDEQFFVYFEDVDFAKRLSLAGGKSYFNASIKAYHIGKGTTAQVKAYRLSLYLTSKLLYAKKYFSPAGYLAIRAVTLLAEPFTRSVFFLFTGRVSEIKETWKGYFLFLKNRKKGHG